MTIKEFSNKYEVPYRIAYLASYEVKPTEPLQYDENELIKETLLNLNKWIGRYRKRIESYNKMIRRLE